MTYAAGRTVAGKGMLGGSSFRYLFVELLKIRHHCGTCCRHCPKLPHVGSRVGSTVVSASPAPWHVAKANKDVFNKNVLGMIS